MRTATGSTGRSPLLDVDGVARALGVTPRHVRRLGGRAEDPILQGRAGSSGSIRANSISGSSSNELMCGDRLRSLARPGDSLVDVQGGLESFDACGHSVGVRLSVGATCLQRRVSCDREPAALRERATTAEWPLPGQLLARRPASHRPPDLQAASRRPCVPRCRLRRHPSGRLDRPRARAGSRSPAMPTSGWRSGPTSGLAPESSTSCSSGTS